MCVTRTFRYRVQLTYNEIKVVLVEKYRRFPDAEREAFYLLNHGHKGVAVISEQVTTKTRVVKRIGGTK